MKASKFFTVLVIGDNPEEILEKYDGNKKVNPYIKYYFKDAKTLQKNAIKLMKKMIDSQDKAQLSDTVVEYLKERVKVIKGLSDFEYYNVITDGLEYDEDGNAISYSNPDAKWKKRNLGQNFCVPFKLLNEDKQTVQAVNKDIDWEYLNNANRKLYELAWKLSHNEVEPQNDEEKRIQMNMSAQGKYLSRFENMEQYVTYNSLYWTNAVVDETGWYDFDGKDMYEWISGYYKNFIEKLGPDAKLTIYECTKAE